MKYYSLTEDMRSGNKWYLGEINDLLFTEQWGFTTEPFFKLDQELNIEVSINGYRTDYTENLTYGVPIVSLDAKKVLDEFNIEFSLCHIFENNNEVELPYYAMGVDILDCINEDMSDYIKYQENDPVIPDRKGDYKMFNKMVLKKSVLGKSHIFRIKGYLVFLVVSEEFKHKVESKGLTGFFLRRNRSWLVCP